MTQLSIQVVGAELVRKGLQNLAAEIPQIGRLQIYRTEQAIVRRMKEYPPPPATSRYIRTFALQSGWTITPRSDGYTISNATPYTKYVVGTAYGTEQAWMHVGRWQLLRNVSDEEIGKLPKAIDDNIMQVARRENL
jgi:hypothetical protein